MDIIGLDLHKRESQLCDQVGRRERSRISGSRRAAPDSVRCSGIARGAKILLEASTESEWVAQLLESLGHEVIVADPNFAAMYATRSRRTKTDKRDARTLAEACRARGLPRCPSDSPPRVGTSARKLAVRDALVRTRTRCIARHQDAACGATDCGCRAAAVDAVAQRVDGARPAGDPRAPKSRRCCARSDAAHGADCRGGCSARGARLRGDRGDRTTR